MRQGEIRILFEPLFNKISKEYGISKDDLFRLTNNEVLILISKRKTPYKEIKKREQLYVYVQKGRKRMILYDKQAQKFIKDFSRLSQHALHGRVAYKGKVVGRARIILGSRDFHKFKKGDILVAVNTSPDYTPLVREASGIIAEEGGITAHVSVISREFKVPCIVGVSQQNF